MYLRNNSFGERRFKGQRLQGIIAHRQQAFPVQAFPVQAFAVQAFAVQAFAVIELLV
jgi:hypothetical protein